MVSVRGTADRGQGHPHAARRARSSASPAGAISARHCRRPPSPARNSGAVAAGIRRLGRRSGVAYWDCVTTSSGCGPARAFAALPSRGGEGVPASLLEAAACGRPLVRDRCAGMPRDPRATASTPCWCRPTTHRRSPTPSTGSPPAPRPTCQIRQRPGRARWSTGEPSSARVGRDVVALYRRLLAKAARAE